MARQLRIEYPGAFYHVSSRGNEGRNIFNSDMDKEKFLSYLENAHQRFNLIIHAYCLMDNHYHLLVETPFPNLSRSMQMINSSYTTYYNLKNKRLGHLFQGRYKAILVDKDSYAQVLSRYIHLNPVRSKITSTPYEYFWSSFHYYIHPEKKPEFLKIDFILGYFGNKGDKTRKDFKKFVEEGLSREISNPSKEVAVGLILGSHSFVQLIKDEYLDYKKKSRDLPSLRELKKDSLSPKKIISVIKEDYGLSEKECINLSVYFLRKFTGYTLEEISRNLSNQMSAAAISQCFLRLEKRRQQDRDLDKKIKLIEGKLLIVEV
ncbi:MAG: transposase [Candidatus Scalinduaceae bacterium]